MRIKYGMGLAGKKYDLGEEIQAANGRRSRSRKII